VEQLLAKLFEEAAVIKQAPLTFAFLWILGTGVIYLTLRRSLRGQLDDFRQWLVDRDNVIEFLQKKLEIQQKFLEPTITAPPELTATTVPALNAPKEEQLLPPVLELIRFDFEDVAKDGSGSYFRASSNLLFKVAVLDFALKPISGAVPWTEVQPQIRFKDSQGRITLVSDAIWFGHDKPKIPFRYGVTASLVLASRSPKRDFRTYERSSHDTRPLERQLNGETMLAEVRLVGEYMDDPKADLSWYFELTKGDPPRIIKSTREKFESEV
jgi:hypothetical protein